MLIAILSTLGTVVAFRLCSLSYMHAVFTLCLLAIAQYLQFIFGGKCEVPSISDVIALILSRNHNLLIIFYQLRSLQHYCHDLVDRVAIVEHGQGVAIPVTKICEQDCAVIKAALNLASSSQKNMLLCTANVQAFQHMIQALQLNQSSPKPDTSNIFEYYDSSMESGSLKHLFDLAKALCHVDSTHAQRSRFNSF